MDKLVVKKDKCIGCGICVNDNPAYFEFDDEGLSEVKKESVDVKDKEALLDTIEQCPTEAIVIEN